MSTLLWRDRGKPRTGVVGNRTEIWTRVLQSTPTFCRLFGYEISSCVCRVSYVVCRMSCVVCRVSYVVYRVSYVVYRMSCVVCRVSYVVCRMSCVVCRVSCVVCRVSYVVCRMSYLTYFEPLSALMKIRAKLRFLDSVGQGVKLTTHLYLVFEVKNDWSYASTPPYLHDVYRNDCILELEICKAGEWTLWCARNCVSGYGSLEWSVGREVIMWRKRLSFFFFLRLSVWSKMKFE
jgi:hypothetical protein